MKKHHSTISRRSLLRALGLGGVGLGASTALGGAPLALDTEVHDLDELIAAPAAVEKRPSWVKEADKPTVDVDWKLKKNRFDYHHVVIASGLKMAVGEEQYNTIQALKKSNRTKFLKENLPGYRLPDVALSSANNRAVNSFIGPATSPTPESLGVPRWEGTPEENARLIRSFLRLHGATHIGFTLLETDTTEKMIYSYDRTNGEGQGPRIDILDVDQPEDNPAKGYRVIPKKARTVIVYSMRMADELMKRPLSQIGNHAHGYMYDLQSLLQGQLQQFLRTLGYMCLGDSTSNNLGPSAGFGVLAGLGELSRMGHLISPDHGLMQRVFKCFTDLPIAPTKPVNFGAFNFCRTCKKCAELCPSGAICKDTEPSWDTKDKPWFSPGVKGYYGAEEKCWAWSTTVGGCAKCYGVCPFSKKPQSSFARTMRASVATTPALNEFWKRADDAIYKNGIRDKEDYEKFWGLDLPVFGYE